MVSMNPKGSRMVCEFKIPSRGIIGLRNQLLTATAGEAIMNHRFIEYSPFQRKNRRSNKWLFDFYGKRFSYSIFFR
jgi:predicted membrane GTPase involved in stress response